MEVFLFEDITASKNEKLTYVSAIYLIGVNERNLNLLFDEIKAPSFKDYHIYFLNDVQDDIIRKIAEHDQ